MNAAEARTKLLLFIAGPANARSTAAVTNIHRALIELRDRAFTLEIVNVNEDPERALVDRVMVTPTLLAPDSSLRLVGDLSERTQLNYFLKTLP